VRVCIKIISLKWQMKNASELFGITKISEASEK